MSSPFSAIKYNINPFISNLWFLLKGQKKGRRGITIRKERPFYISPSSKIMGMLLSSNLKPELNLIYIYIEDIYTKDYQEAESTQVDFVLYLVTGVNRVPSIATLSAIRLVDGGAYQDWAIANHSL